MILESPVDYDKTSTYNQNAVLIEIPYDSTLQDLQNITSSNNSCTLMPVHNNSGNIIEPITNLEITPAKTLNSNPEYQEPVKIVINGRKQGRIIVNKKKEKQFHKNHITSEYVFSNNCTHTNNNKNSGCQISKLSVEDIKLFRNNLSELSNKIDQDKFILTLLLIKNPERTDRHKSERKQRNVIKYYIPNKVGDKIPVCLKIFSQVTSFSPRRLNILCSKFLSTASSPKENRGGSRKTRNSDEVSTSIIEFISKLKCKKSHYARNDSSRSYLPPQWSVNFLFEQWKKKRICINKPIASRGKFHSIFTGNFNLGFGHPRQDVCSYCSELSVKIKTENDNEKKEELSNELKSHQIFSKIFSKTMLTVKPGSINVSFDMMQNQAIPKLSVTDTFYSRQIWLYNLTFVINFSNSEQSPENCHLYTWLESESARGPNEVCSILLHFLGILEDRVRKESSITVLNLFSDSCSAQNKNQFIVATLLYYMNTKNTIFERINHIFPVRGHSYMPPDQVFGRIEKCLRKEEIIVSPHQYYDIFKKFTTVHVLNKDYVMYDIKNIVKTFMKPNVIKTTEQKVFTYYKGIKTVSVSSKYDNNPSTTQTISVLKRGTSLTVLDRKTILPKVNYVKPPKQNDVKNLMRFFVIPEEAKEFYIDIFKPKEPNQKEDDHEDENDIPVYNEDTAF